MHVVAIFSISLYLWAKNQSKGIKSENFENYKKEIPIGKKTAMQLEYTLHKYIDTYVSIYNADTPKKTWDLNSLNTVRCISSASFGSLLLIFVSGYSLSIFYSLHFFLFIFSGNRNRVFVFVWCWSWMVSLVQAPYQREKVQRYKTCLIKFLNFFFRKKKTNNDSLFVFVFNVAYFKKMVFFLSF